MSRQAAASPRRSRAARTGPPDEDARDPGDAALAPGRSPLASCLLLAVLTVVCLAPFLNRAFNIDEPLFVWAARQIAAHPLDPYGFRVNWYTTPMPMSEVTKNPPLASYYAALAGSIAGWSERPLHLAFLLPALVAVLGTYLLARRLCRRPLLAAMATLLAPGFLASASTVMCDTTMLAFFVLAVLFWVEGFERGRPLLLAASALLIAAGSLTKYFAVSLVPLLLVWSLLRTRRLGAWAGYLLVPVVVLAGYQIATQALYGMGLLWDAATYATGVRGVLGGHRLVATLDSIVFAGGCALPALLFAPFLWRWRGILVGAILGGLAGLAVWVGWLPVEGMSVVDHRALVSLQFAVFAGGGLSLLALAGADLRKGDSALLAAWVVGTVFFAGAVNWTVNARSVLPLIPAAGILLARRLDRTLPTSPRWRPAMLAAPLAISGVLAIGTTFADAELADTARRAATVVHERTQGQAGTVWFQGHWGFQYYMEALGARAVDSDGDEVEPGDFMVVPEFNVNLTRVRPGAVEAKTILEMPLPGWLTTWHPRRGAGFHSATTGPLPFAFGPVPPERYAIFRLRAPSAVEPAVVPGPD